MQSNALKQSKEAVQVNGDRAENESDESELDDDSEDDEETTGKEMVDATQEDSRLASIPQVCTAACRNCDKDLGVSCNAKLK